MKRLHLIVDFQFIYYKYLFKYKSGYIGKLTYDLPTGEDGQTEVKDVTMIYLCLKEIEMFRREYIELSPKDCEITMSICFDSKSKRKQQSGGEQYKEGRVNKLEGEDFSNISEIREILKDAGYNVFKKEGYEADDIIAELVSRYKDRYDHTVIFTIDKDIMSNICDNVSVNRFKQNKGYKTVKKGNYEDYLSEEYKCKMPYNSISLYLSTVGDQSDNIKGIYKFGAKAFEKMINRLSDIGFDFSECGTEDGVKAAIDKAKSLGIISDVQAIEAFASYDLVKPMRIEDGEMNDIELLPCDSKKRVEAYSKYGLVSLYE